MDIPREKKVEWTEAEKLGGWMDKNHCYFCRKLSWAGCQCQGMSRANNYDYQGRQSGVRYCPECWERCSFPEPWTHCVRGAAALPSGVAAGIPSGSSASDIGLPVRPVPVPVPPRREVRVVHGLVPFGMRPEVRDSPRWM